ncbi:MAG: carbon monoxide dehydrogenase [Chloroflexi bacterium RBG_16_57_11]|nr:MAG: carbon monoxide dehydrogenase [Chloroflexi bacterium RBG_16_57_11]
MLYKRAFSITDLVSQLSSDKDGVKILAGGTDLIVQLREGRRKARALVDIKNIPEANVLSYDPGSGLTIGAAVPCYRIRQEAAIARYYPGLIDAVELIGGVQIQGRATLGGNLCNASPAADSIPALIVNEATCTIAGLGGMRQVAVEDCCTAPGQTILEQAEFLLSLHLPPPRPRSGAAYLRFIPRNEMDIAVVGAGASVVLDESSTVIASARVALGAVAPTPLFVSEASDYLTNREISPQVVREVARMAQDACRPITDLRGTAAQRRHLVGVLTRRSLEKAIQRAQGNI